MREAVQTYVEAQGLVYLGIAPLEVSADFDRFEAWLGDGNHAGMEFLVRNREVRKDPQKLFPEAKAAVVVGFPYDLGDKWETDYPPRIAQYARLRDYHKTLREKGEAIGRAIGGTFRVVVDSAPLLERALAAQTGTGFVGKNTCFIHPTRGSFLLLAEILVSADIAPVETSKIDSTKRTPGGGCGTCDLCQVHCPTGALAKDYSIDARLCLAYWTIEHRGAIPEAFWPHLGKYYFGCDLCQLVCPYTRKASQKFQVEAEEKTFPSLFETATMDQAKYEAYFGGTPLTRAKRNGLRRNALIAMTVTDDKRLFEAMAIAERDPASPVGETLDQIRRYRERERLLR